jgi:hypothetical protein
MAERIPEPEAGSQNFGAGKILRGAVELPDFEISREVCALNFAPRIL